MDWEAELEKEGILSEKTLAGRKIIWKRLAAVLLVAYFFQWIFTAGLAILFLLVTVAVVSTHIPHAWSLFDFILRQQATEVFAGLAFGAVMGWFAHLAEIATRKQRSLEGYA